MTTDDRALLADLFDAAIRAADPARALAPHLPSVPRGRTVVIGAGKGAAQLARAFEDAWPAPCEGVVVTRYGYGAPTHQIRVLEAAHPVPDAHGLAAAKRILALASVAGPEDLVLCLFSGGGSALLTLPAEGLTLTDKQTVNRALLAAGASIDEINTVRKHLSAIKGGRLAAAAPPARVVTLAISDVPGDDPSAIGSGPTVGDPTSLEDARTILSDFKVDLPASVEVALSDDRNETPAPDDPAFEGNVFTLVSRPADALAAAADMAKSLGYAVEMMGDSLEGEAREVAREHAKLALRHAAEGKRTALLSGGEFTVTVTGNGKGGPNQEYALSLLEALDGAENIWALAADTDGTDGGEGAADDPAGAIVAPASRARAAELGLNPAEFLQNNDSTGFFGKTGDLVITGPTRTNVNDFRVILVDC